MEWRTGLEPPTFGRKSAETQGSGTLKLVSRVYPGLMGGPQAAPVPGRQPVLVPKEEEAVA